MAIVSVRACAIPDESAGTVIVAGLANLAIAIAKLIGGLISHSSAMLSEDHFRAYAGPSLSPWSSKILKPWPSRSPSTLR